MPMPEAPPVMIATRSANLPSAIFSLRIEFEIALSCVPDRQASIYWNDCAGDIGSGRKTQAERNVRDLLGIAVALQGGPAFRKNCLVLFRNRVCQCGANGSGANAIDGDP